MATQQHGETVPVSSSSSSSSCPFPSLSGASSGRDCPWVFGEDQGSTFTSVINRGGSPPPVIIGNRQRSAAGEGVRDSMSSGPPHEPIPPVGFPQSQGQPPKQGQQEGAQEPLMVSGCSGLRSHNNVNVCGDREEGIPPFHHYHDDGSGDVRSMPMAPGLPSYRYPQREQPEGCHHSGSGNLDRMGRQGQGRGMVMVNGCDSGGSSSSVQYCHVGRDTTEDFYDPSALHVSLSSRVLLPSPPHLSHHQHQIPPVAPPSYYEPPYEGFSSIKLRPTPRDHARCLHHDQKSLNGHNNDNNEKRKDNLLGEGGENVRRLSPSPSESLPYTVYDHQPCIRRLSSEDSHDAALRRARHQYLKRGGVGSGGTSVPSHQYVCPVDAGGGENGPPSAESGSSSQIVSTHSPMTGSSFAQGHTGNEGGGPHTITAANSLIIMAASRPGSVSSCTQPRASLLPPDHRGVVGHFHPPNAFLGDTPGGYVPQHFRPSPSLIEEARARGAAEADRFFQRFQERQQEMMMYQRRAPGALGGGGEGGGDEVANSSSSHSSFQETTIGFDRNRSEEGSSLGMSTSASSRQSYGRGESSQGVMGPRQIFSVSPPHQHLGGFFHINRRSSCGEEERVAEGENTRGFLPNEEGTDERMMSSCCSGEGEGGGSMSSGHSQGNGSSSQQQSPDSIAFSGREEQGGGGVYSFAPAFHHPGDLAGRGGPSSGAHPFHHFSSSYEGRGGEQQEESSCSPISGIDARTLRPPSCLHPSLQSNVTSAANTATGAPAPSLAPSLSMDVYPQRRTTGDDPQQPPPPRLPCDFSERRPEVPFALGRDEPHQQGRDGALGTNSYHNNSRRSSGARPGFDYETGGMESRQSLPPHPSQLMRAPPNYACPPGRQAHQQIPPPLTGFVPSSSSSTAAPNGSHPSHPFLPRTQHYEQSCFSPSFLLPSDVSRRGPPSMVMGKEEVREESRATPQQLCAAGGSASGACGQGDSVLASFSSDSRPSRWGGEGLLSSTSGYQYEQGHHHTAGERRGALNEDGKPATPLYMMRGRQEGNHLERCPPVSLSSSQSCGRVDGGEGGGYPSSCWSRPIGFFYGARNDSRGEGGGSAGEQGDASGCWMDASRRQMDNDENEETNRGSEFHRERQGGSFPREMRAASDSRIGLSREKMVLASPGEGGKEILGNEETHANQEEAKAKQTCEEEERKGEERHKDNSSRGSTPPTSSYRRCVGSGNADESRGSSHVEGDFRNVRGLLSLSGGRRMNDDIEEETLGGVGGRRKHHSLDATGALGPPPFSSSSSNHPFLSGQDCCFFTSSSSSSFRGSSSLLPPPPSPPHHHGAMRSLSEHATPSYHSHHHNSTSSSHSRGPSSSRSSTTTSQSLGEPLIRDNQYSQVLSHDGSVSRSFPGLLEAQLYHHPRRVSGGRAVLREGQMGAPSFIDDDHEDMRQPVRYTSLDRGLPVPTHQQGLSRERPSISSRSNCVGGDGNVDGGGAGTSILSDDWRRGRRGKHQDQPSVEICSHGGVHEGHHDLHKVHHQRGEAERTEGLDKPSETPGLPPAYCEGVSSPSCSHRHLRDENSPQSPRSGEKSHNALREQKEEEGAPQGAWRGDDSDDGRRRGLIDRSVYEQRERPTENRSLSASRCDGPYSLLSRSDRNEFRSLLHDREALNPSSSVSSGEVDRRFIPTSPEERERVVGGNESPSSERFPDPHRENRTEDRTTRRVQSSDRDQPRDVRGDNDDLSSRSVDQQREREKFGMKNAKMVSPPQTGMSPISERRGGEAQQQQGEKVHTSLFTGRYEACSASSFFHSGSSTVIAPQSISSSPSLMSSSTLCNSRDPPCHLSGSADLPPTSTPAVVGDGGIGSGVCFLSSNGASIDGLPHGGVSAACDRINQNPLRHPVSVAGGTGGGDLSSGNLLSHLDERHRSLVLLPPLDPESPRRVNGASAASDTASQDILRSCCYEEGMSKEDKEMNGSSKKISTAGGIDMHANLNGPYFSEPPSPVHQRYSDQPPSTFSTSSSYHHHPEHPSVFSLANAAGSSSSSIPSHPHLHSNAHQSTAPGLLPLPIRGGGIGSRGRSHGGGQSSSKTSSRGPPVLLTERRGRGDPEALSPPSPSALLHRRPHLDSSSPSPQELPRGEDSSDQRRPASDSSEGKNDGEDMKTSEGLERWTSSKCTGEEERFPHSKDRGSSQSIITEGEGNADEKEKSTTHQDTTNAHGIVGEGGEGSSHHDSSHSGSISWSRGGEHHHAFSGDSGHHPPSKTKGEGALIIASSSSSSGGTRRDRDLQCLNEQANTSRGGGGRMYGGSFSASEGRDGGRQQGREERENLPLNSLRSTKDDTHHVHSSKIGGSTSSSSTSSSHSNHHSRRRGQQTWHPGTSPYIRIHHEHPPYHRNSSSNPHKMFTTSSGRPSDKSKGCGGDSSEKEERGKGGTKDSFSRKPSCFSSSSLSTGAQQRKAGGGAGRRLLNEEEEEGETSSRSSVRSGSTRDREKGSSDDSPSAGGQDTTSMAAVVVVVAESGSEVGGGEREGEGEREGCLRTLHGDTSSHSSTQNSFVRSSSSSSTSASSSVSPVECSEDPGNVKGSCSPSSSIVTPEKNSSLRLSTSSSSQDIEREDAVKHQQEKVGEVEKEEERKKTSLSPSKTQKQGKEEKQRVDDEEKSKGWKKVAAHRADGEGHDELSEALKEDGGSERTREEGRRKEERGGDSRAEKVRQTTDTKEREKETAGNQGITEEGVIDEENPAGQEKSSSSFSSSRLSLSCLSSFSSSSSRPREPFSISTSLAAMASPLPPPPSSSSSSGVGGSSGAVWGSSSSGGGGVTGHRNSSRASRILGGGGGHPPPFSQSTRRGTDSLSSSLSNSTALTSGTGPSTTAGDRHLHHPKYSRSSESSSYYSSSSSSWHHSPHQHHPPPPHSGDAIHYRAIALVEGDAVPPSSSSGRDYKNSRGGGGDVSSSFFQPQDREREREEGRGSSHHSNSSSGGSTTVKGGGNGGSFLTRVSQPSQGGISKFVVGGAATSSGEIASIPCGPLNSTPGTEESTCCQSITEEASLISRSSEGGGSPTTTSSSTASCMMVTSPQAKTQGDTTYPSDDKGLDKTTATNTKQDDSTDRDDDDKGAFERSHKTGDSSADNPSQQQSSDAPGGNHETRPTTGNSLPRGDVRSFSSSVRTSSSSDQTGGRHMGRSNPGRTRSPHRGGGGDHLSLSPGAPQAPEGGVSVKRDGSPENLRAMAFSSSKEGKRGADHSGGNLSRLGSSGGGGIRRGVECLRPESGAGDGEGGVGRSVSSSFSVVSSSRNSGTSSSPP
ncbi:hypothetical protein CSUI_004485, partial [Cystoisospora suis]